MLAAWDLLFPIVVLATGALAVTGRWKLALLGLLIYLGLLDGYFRLREGDPDLTLVRDGLLYGIAAAALVRALVRGERLALPPLLGLILLLICVALMQV